MTIYPSISGALLFCAALSCSAQSLDPQDTRTATLKQAIQISSQHGYKAAALDWAKIEANALAILAADDSEGALTASLEYVIAKLEDGHSAYRPPSASPPTTLPPAVARRREIVASETAGDFPLVRVNAWTGQDAAAAREASASLRSALNAALSQEVCGLLVDFSSNSGGNMWPMLAGLLPIYEEGLLGAFEGADGQRTLIVSDGIGLSMGGKPHYLNVPALPKPKHLPRHVAVLIGPRTASSGEIVALMLIAQDNSESFGAATAGRSSANRVFPLANGGMLILTTAATVDRHGSKYWEPIAPDHPAEDAKTAAVSWLSAQCGAPPASRS